MEKSNRYDHITTQGKYSYFKKQTNMLRASAKIKQTSKRREKSCWLLATNAGSATIEVSLQTPYRRSKKADQQISIVAKHFR